MNFFSKKERGTKKRETKKRETKGQAAKIPAKRSVAPNNNNNNTVVGYISKGGRLLPYGIPDEDLQNLFLGGEIKSGKTTVMKSMIIQDILKDRGVLVLDPHMNLVTDLMGMIPREKHDKIVYISMDSASLFDGWTVRINPIECDNDEERPFVVQSYMHLTESFHGRYWGPRVAVVIRNLVNTLVYLENYKHTDLMKILTDEKYRQYVMTKVPLKHVREFWEVIYPKKLAAEATGTAYNKLDEIVTTPNIAMILDTVHSSIDMSEMIDNGNIILVNLQSGTSEELARFMGSVLLHLFSVEGRNKQKKGTCNIRPFSIYVDEAHEFAPQILRELLNRVRKWGAKMTIASQSITKFEKTLGSEISSLCTAIALFRTNRDTAKMFEDRMALDANQIVNLNTHQFALYVNANPPLYAVAQTKHMPSVDEDVWMEIATKSVKKYGQKIDVTKYIPITGRHKGPKFTPLEFFILNTLYLEHRDMTKDEILALAQKKFDVTPREVNGALLDTLCSTYRYAEMHNVKDDDGDANLNLRFSISSLATGTIYSRAVAGRRAGHDIHLGKLFELMDMHLRQHNYCELDRADTNKDKADLLVYSFLPEDVRLRTGKDSAGNGSKSDQYGNSGTSSVTDAGTAGRYSQYDPQNWSENVVAIEVETAPSKHASQIIKNFEKNWKKGYFVAFVVFSEKERDVIYAALDGNDVARTDYSVTVDKSLADLDGNKKKKKKEMFCTVENTKHITADEERMILLFAEEDSGRTTEMLVDNMNGHMTPRNVLAVLHSMEQKGLVQRSSVEQTRKIESLTGDMPRKARSRKEVWLKTDKFPKRKAGTSPDDDDVLQDDFVRTDSHDPEESRAIPEHKQMECHDSRYKSTDRMALLMLVDDGTPDEAAILAELKRRGYGVRRNKSGSKTLFRLPKKGHGQTGLCRFFC